MSKINVLYLSYDGLTDPLGQSQVLPYLIGLSKSGYRFYILSFEKRKAYETGHRIIKELISESDLEWHPQIYHKHPPILSTLMDVWVMHRRARKLIERHSVKLVHCRSYISGLVGLKLKRDKGIRFLFDMRGFWADERVDGGIWDLKNPIFAQVYRYFKRMEREMLYEADHIISLTNTGKEEISSGKLMKDSGGVSQNSISVIPCAVDLDLFDPKTIHSQDQEVLKKELGLENAEHILVYLGSIGTWYLLDEMLGYFKQYEAHKEASYFLIVSRDDPSHILQRAVKLGVDAKQVIVQGAQRKEVPKYLSIATLGIFFIKPVYSKKASSATKMGEMLAMGLRIVTNLGVGDVEYLVDRFDLNKMIRSYRLDLNSDLEVIEIEGSQASEIAKEYFSLDSGLHTYINVYKTIT